MKWVASTGWKWGTPSEMRLFLIGIALMLASPALWAQHHAPLCASADAACLREAYSRPPAHWPAPQVDAGVAWQELGPLPERAPSPAHNPYTEQKAALGRTLFFDPRWSATFWNALWNNTWFFIIHMLVQNPIGIALAAILSTPRLRMAAFYRTAIFIPTILSFVIVGFVWKLILSPIWGIDASRSSVMHPVAIPKSWIAGWDASPRCRRAACRWSARCRSMRKVRRIRATQRRPNCCGVACRSMR